MAPLQVEFGDDDGEGDEVNLGYETPALTHRTRRADETTNILQIATQ